LDFINSRPPLLRAGIWALVFMGCLGAVVSLATAIKRNWDSRVEDPNRHLYYNYFSGTRTKAVRAIRKEYFELLFSNLWNKSCIYYWVHSFGELALKSRIIGMLAAAPYLAFGVVAVIEFIIKIIAGVLLAIVLIPLELIVYAVAKAIALIACPIASAVSTAQLKSQHCTDCYAEFKKPVMRCPKCGVEHEYISPGEYGLFFARCTCGKLLKIMPRHQQNYSFECPECHAPIAANRNRQTFIGVVAGDGAWESTFIRDLRRDLEAANVGEGRTIAKMGDMSLIASTDPAYPDPSSDPRDAGAVALCCDRRFEHLTTSLVLYALPSDRILNDSFSKSPLLMGQLDGIAFIMDTTKRASGSSAEDQPEREMENIVSLFIQKFQTIKGMKVNHLSPVNVAIAVIGEDSPTGDEASYCERLLDEHGYGHAVAQLQSVFKNIRFFAADKGSVDGVFGPEVMPGMIAWLTRGSRDTAAGMLIKSGKV
ncbi:MAG: hypothetical protein II784_05080, partial [Oscillospiraceae bacterium]|nr:hypothetical protein [Oscillospiraceae bacterium]